MLRRLEGDAILATARVRDGVLRREAFFANAACAYAIQRWRQRLSDARRSEGCRPPGERWRKEATSHGLVPALSLTVGVCGG